MNRTTELEDELRLEKDCFRTQEFFVHDTAPRWTNQNASLIVFRIINSENIRQIHLSYEWHTSLTSDGALWVRYATYGMQQRSLRCCNVINVTYVKSGLCVMITVNDDFCSVILVTYYNAYFIKLTRLGHCVGQFSRVENQQHSIFSFFLKTYNSNEITIDKRFGYLAHFCDSDD